MMPEALQMLIRLTTLCPHRERGRSKAILRQAFGRALCTRSARGVSYNMVWNMLCARGAHAHGPHNARNMRAHNAHTRHAERPHRARIEDAGCTRSARGGVEHTNT